MVGSLVNRLSISRAVSSNVFIFIYILMETARYLCLHFPSPLLRIVWGEYNLLKKDNAQRGIGIEIMKIHERVYEAEHLKNERDTPISIFMHLFFCGNRWILTDFLNNVLQFLITMISFEIADSAYYRILILSKANGVCVINSGGGWLSRKKESQTEIKILWYRFLQVIRKEKFLKTALNFQFPSIPRCTSEKGSKGSRERWTQWLDSEYFSFLQIIVVEN